MTIQRAIVMINLILLTLAAYFGVGLFYQMLGLENQSWPVALDAAAGAADERQDQDQPFSHYQTILERDLFRTQKTAQVPQGSKMDLDNLEQTQLKLKLWGTVSGNPDTAYAVIEDLQKREQNLYRAGDTIQNATVKTILREKVVLSVEGRDEVLSMEEVTQGSPPPGYRSLPARRPEVASAESEQVAQQQISLQRGMINEAIQDVGKLMSEAVVQPYLEEGQPAGLAIQNIKPNSIFLRMGLRNGDILTGVDGQDIRSVDDALRLYENLKSASDVSVQIKRRGQERTINYNIR